MGLALVQHMTQIVVPGRDSRPRADWPAPGGVARRWVGGLLPEGKALLRGCPLLLRGWNKGGSRAVIVQEHGIPIELSGGVPRDVRLPVGDDLPAAEAADGIARLELLIRLADGGAIDTLEVKLNGRLLAAVDRDAAAGETRFRPDGSLFIPGENKLRLRTDVATDVTAVEVYVQYKKERIP